MTHWVDVDDELLCVFDESLRRRRLDAPPKQDLPAHHWSRRRHTKRLVSVKSLLCIAVTAMVALTAFVLM